MVIDPAPGTDLADLRSRCHIHNTFLFRLLAPRSSFRNYLYGGDSGGFDERRSVRVLWMPSDWVTCRGTAARICRVSQPFLV